MPGEMTPGACNRARLLCKPISSPSSLIPFLHSVSRDARRLIAAPDLHRHPLLCRSSSPETNYFLSSASGLVPRCKPIPVTSYVKTKSRLTASQKLDASVALFPLHYLLFIIIFFLLPSDRSCGPSIKSSYPPRDRSRIIVIVLFSSARSTTGEIHFVSETGKYRTHAVGRSGKGVEIR